ncbi:MAG: hypothetical protein V2I46_12285 [Bacteroides sp.]|jgi:hypothetical protein|nr:hypothetical protein [Bacteroides sp.]
MSWTSDKKFWYNPFDYLAGGKALLIGLGLMVLASLAGTLTHVWFPGALDLKLDYAGSYWIHLGTSVMSWLVVLAVLYPLALGLTSSKIRLVDMAGTLALARAPQLLAALTGTGAIVSKAMNNLLYTLTRDSGQAIPPQLLGTLTPVDLKGWEWFLAFNLMALQLLTIIWMVALMYNAYRISANLKGNRAGISFVIGLLIAEALSVFLVFRFILPML